MLIYSSIFASHKGLDLGPESLPINLHRVILKLSESVKCLYTPSLSFPIWGLDLGPGSLPIKFPGSPWSSQNRSWTQLMSSRHHLQAWLQHLWCVAGSPPRCFSWRQLQASKERHLVHQWFVLLWILIEDRMDHWRVSLPASSFPEGSNLRKDLFDYARRYNRDPEVVFDVTFPSSYPFEPPFVRVLRPRFQFHTGWITKQKHKICQKTNLQSR